MNPLCSHPDCAEDAGVTIQRQADVEAVPYCLQHGYQREAELKQRLENYRLVTIVAMVPTELDLAKARVAELEAAGESAEAIRGHVQGAAEQLATTLHTLETQARALSGARSDLSDCDDAIKVLRAELKRTREQLDRVQAQRDELHSELARFQAERAAEQTTMPEQSEPTTQPDPHP